MIYFRGSREGVLLFKTLRLVSREILLMLLLSIDVDFYASFIWQKHL